MTSIAQRLDRGTEPRPVGLLTSTLTITRRAGLRYVRTPQLIVMATLQMSLFFLIYRYMFGGSIHAGSIPYVDYLVPGYAATIVLFSGGGIAVAVAEDRAEGFTDRLLSLPLPRRALVLGRALADSITNAWSIVTTVAVGFLFGFRLHGSVLDGLGALGLCLVYGVVFTLVFIVMGLFAPNVQAAQGMSLIAFILAFISSTYVPAASMPGWLERFAENQPITPMVNAVRSLLTGSSHDVALALAWSALLLAVFTPIAVARYRKA